MTYRKKAFFWNLIAKKYSRQPIANEEAYQYKLDQTKGYLTADSKVLEIGCGTGSTSLYHAPNVAHILAVDISKNMIKIAQDKADHANVTNIDFQCATIEEFVFEDASFDVGLALSILHLVEDRAGVLKKLNQALKPGGVLITSTICVKEVLPVLRWLAGIGYFCGFLPLIKCFNSKELEDSIKQAGFTIENIWRPNPKEATFIIARKEK